MRFGEWQKNKERAQKSKLRPLSRPPSPRTRYKKFAHHSIEILMTEKVLLSDIKRTQNSCSSLCPLWQKTNPKRPKNALCAKKFVFRAQNAHKTSGMAWRKMAVFVGIMAKFVRQFGQILHNEGGGKWRKMSGEWPLYGSPPRFGDGKKDGYGFSIFNGKMPRRVS